MVPTYYFEYPGVLLGQHFQNCAGAQKNTNLQLSEQNSFKL